MATELKRQESALGRIEELLGEDGRELLEFSSPKISKDSLQTPGPDFVDRVWAHSDRNPQVVRSLQLLFDSGRLAGTGYLSILPVDQGIEPNRRYFDPDNIVKLAIEGGCNAVASTFGVFGVVARKYAHKIPFIIKINHKELLAYPCRVMSRMSYVGGLDMLMRSVDGAPKGNAMFSINQENTSNRRAIYLDRKLLRRRAEWECYREKVFFYYGVVLFGCLSIGLGIACLTAFLSNNASEILKLSAIAALGGLVRAVIKVFLKGNRAD